MKKFSMMLVMIFMFSIISIQGVSAKEFPERMIHESSKPWTITFSEQVDKSSVNNETVYIEYLNEKIPIDITYNFNEDGTQLIVSPVSDYEMGYNFKLVVTENVKSVSGVNLNEETTLIFNYMKEEDVFKPMPYDGN